MAGTAVVACLAAVLGGGQGVAAQSGGGSLRNDIPPPAPLAKEKVFASDDVKNALAKHQVLLIPLPPKPPQYAANGTQYGDITQGKDFSYDPVGGAGKADWCLGSADEHRYTSERGSIMLNGHPLFLKGINWYGFETELFVPHGLFVWSPEQFMKFLATHRFNAVRLPFSLEWAARGLDAPLLNPYVVQPDAATLTQGQLLERIFDAAAAEGIVILLDLHVISVEVGIVDLWYDETADNERVLDIWTQVLSRVAGRWNLMGIDIKNEPHGIATWGRGNPKTDWNLFAQQAIQTLAARVPQFQGVFFVEGVEGHRWETPYPYWWGGNFDGVKHAPIRTGSEELDKRVVYSPHIYGPEVFSSHNYFKDPKYPENMFDIWNQQFGWIEKATGRAVVVGEWGGSIVGDKLAAANQQKLAEWMVHSCIPDNFWWCLNPATKFNGGLLGETFQIVDENVLRILHYVQPKPTRLHHNKDGNSLCVEDGAFASTRCSLKMGLGIPHSQGALKAEVEIQP